MQISLLTEENQLERLSKLGDSLERLKIIDFESFCPTLSNGLKKERKRRTGRPPFDGVVLFKVLVLQRLFNLYDDQTEYQITDRISFQRFLGLSLGEKVPDAKTIWLFRNTLTGRQGQGFPGSSSGADRASAPSVGGQPESDRGSGNRQPHDNPGIPRAFRRRDRGMVSR